MYRSQSIQTKGDAADSGHFFFRTFSRIPAITAAPAMAPPMIRGFLRVRAGGVQSSLVSAHDQP